MHGSHKGRTAHDGLLSQILTHDFWILTKATGATLNLDALKCFDRIRPHVVSLEMSRMGMSRGVGECMERVFQGMSHKVRTAYGVSKKGIQQGHR